MIPSFKSLYISRSSSIRLFSNSSCSQGKIRKLLNIAAEDDIYIKPTTNYDRYQKKARKVKAGEERTAASLRKQKAADVLQRKLKENIDHKKLGPTSDEDLKYFQHADRRTLYALLGVTEDQILDSVVVSRSVEAFLKRGQTEKAMTLAKIAKDKGIVSMNFIVEYFIQQGRINSALDLHTFRKKWGVPLNDQSMTMLFDAVAEYKPLKRDQEVLTRVQAIRLKEIYLAATRKEGYKPNLIHFNSCLSALMRAKDQSPAIDLFNQVEELKIRPDMKSCTIVLQGLSHAENDVWAVVQALEIYQKLMKLPEERLDNRVLEALVRVFTSREKAYLVKKGIILAQNCFKLPQDIAKIERFKKAKPAQKGEQLDIGEFFILHNKLDPTAALIDSVMLAASKIGDDRLAIKFFNTFEEDGFVKRIDRGLVHRLLTVTQRYDAKNAGELSIKIYRRFHNSDQYAHVKLNDQTKYLVFDGLAIQAKSNYDLQNGRVRNYDRVKVVFKFIEQFMSMVEAPYNLKVFSGYLKAVRGLPLSDERRAAVRVRLQTMRKFISEYRDIRSSKPEIEKFVKHLNTVERHFAKEIQAKNISIKKEDLESVSV